MKNKKRNYECHLSSCSHVNSKRTTSQNSALWLYFQLLADELNNAGYPIKKTLESYKIDIDWDKNSVADLIWRPVQKALLNKKSTTELRKTDDIEKVWEHLNRFLGEKLGIHVPFPNDPSKHEEKQYLGSKGVAYPEGPTETVF